MPEQGQAADGAVGEVRDRNNFLHFVFTPLGPAPYDNGVTSLSDIEPADFYFPE